MNKSSPKKNEDTRIVGGRTAELKAKRHENSGKGEKFGEVGCRKPWGSSGGKWR